MYQHGDGVPKSDQSSIHWLTLAAEQGDANAQCKLGLLYVDGKGVEENNEAAVKWFTLAAKQGYAQAQINLGFLYEYGNGIARDDIRAYMWYHLSDHNGNQRSAKNKEQIANRMTSTQIAKALKMSTRCLKSGYKHC